MMMHGMDAALSEPQSAFTVEPNAERLLHANLAALLESQTYAITAIRSASLPHNLERVTGRDGTPTYCLRDATGNATQWLGPTTTPFVTADALLGKFDAGMGNVLLPMIGDGSMASALLAKLRPHQALFVVEPEAWRAKAALMLYDFTVAAREGRLVLCVGPDGWEQLRQFLAACPGYLPPERTLALPWIDAAQMRAIQAEMQALQATPVSNSGERHPDAGERSTATKRVAFVSNSLAPEAQYIARQLETAANDDDSCDAFCSVPDRPDSLHPNFVQTRLNALQPTHLLLIDCGPQDLSVALPEAPKHIVISHGDDISVTLFKQDMQNTRWWVRSNAQRAAAISAGVDQDRVATYVPTCCVATEPAAISMDRIVVAGPTHVPEAEHVGLNLGSHRALWRACATIISERVDSYTDEHADQVLRDAERTLKTSIQSDDVRAGLVERVRQHLGPAVIAARVRDALATLNIEVIATPQATLLRDTPHAPVVWINTSRVIHPAAIRLAAAGIPIALRSTNASAAETDDELLQVMPAFANLDSLTALIDDWQRNAESLARQVTRVLKHLDASSMQSASLFQKFVNAKSV